MKHKVLSVQQVWELYELGWNCFDGSMVWVDYDTPMSGVELEIYDKNKRYPRRHFVTYTLGDILPYLPADTRVGGLTLDNAYTLLIKTLNN